jgi:hypothetical protein
MCGENGKDLFRFIAPCPELHVLRNELFSGNVGPSEWFVSIMESKDYGRKKRSQNIRKWE